MAMDRNGITTAIFLFLIVVDVSNASSSFWKLRYLADESPSKNDTTDATPPSFRSTNPVSGLGTKISDSKQDNSTKLEPNSSGKADSVTSPPDDKKDPKPSGKPEKVSPSPQKEIDSGNNSSLTSNSKKDKTMEENEENKKNADIGKNPNSTDTEKGASTKEEKKRKKKKKSNADENDSKSGVAETCDGIDSRCEDGNSLTACIKGFATGYKELVVLIHNSGEKTLKVNLVGPSGESLHKDLTVLKHGTERLNISLTVSKPSEIVLTAGNGDCVLHLNPLVSEQNFFSKLPSYDKLLTPVNGAYFLIVAVVIFGGSWACCMFRKRRWHDGIPYQELEMGFPESMAATDVETAEGWDQGWDDDWDEDKAVKSPLGRNVATISANGLTARSSNRDGWENDWDD